VGTATQVAYRGAPDAGFGVLPMDRAVFARSPGDGGDPSAATRANASGPGTATNRYDGTFTTPAISSGGTQSGTQVSFPAGQQDKSTQNSKSWQSSLVVQEVVVGQPWKVLRLPQIVSASTVTKQPHSGVPRYLPDCPSRSRCSPSNRECWVARTERTPRAALPARRVRAPRCGSPLPPAP
jgi:hypothetical protein